jgi:hypothetical protein
MLIVVSAFSLAAQEDEGGILGDWKQSFASPSYGVSALLVHIADEDGRHITPEEGEAIGGIDLRLAQGVNVARRGGFFVGYEIGTMLFMVEPGQFTFTDEWLGVEYEVAPEMTLGMVYLMAKYGLRLDLGVGIAGVSVGAEIGLGARMASGMLGFSAEVDGVEAAHVSGVKGDLDVVLDVAAEGAVRLGRNFRLFARLGALVTPPLIQTDSRLFWENFPALDNDDPGIPGVIDGPGEGHALLARYQFYNPLFIPAARVGFILNY